MQTETLIYNEDGFAWVRTDRAGTDGDLADEGNPAAKFPTLMHAYQAAARHGYRPTRWKRPGDEYALPLDHADHWRRLAGIDD